MTTATYRRLLLLARRHAPSADLAPDLLHDALLVAARDQVDLGADAGQRWLGGVLRNLARHQARTDRRRRRREGRTAVEPVSSASEPNAAPEQHQREPWQRLPPASRRVVVLALHGLGKREICAVLGLSDAAFRQRLATARRALSSFPDDARRDVLACARAARQRRGAGRDLGLLRRALRRSLRTPSAVGTHDVDGHLVVLSP